MNHWLFYPLLTALGVAAVAAILAGLWLLARPGGAHHLTDDQSLYELIRWSRRPYRVERFIYRHHRLFGGLMMAGTLLLLWGLWIASPHTNLYRLAFTHGDFLSTELLMALQTTGLVLSVGALFAFIVGAVIFARPSLLKGIESWANQPVTLRMIVEALRRLRHTPNHWTVNHPRVIALLLLGAGIYLLILIFTSFPAILTAN